MLSGLQKLWHYLVCPSLGQRRLVCIENWPQVLNSPWNQSCKKRIRNTEDTSDFEWDGCSFLRQYRSVPHIRPPYVFSQSSCTGIFISRIGPPNHGLTTKMIFVETPTLSSSRSPWQRKNGASVHRTAKEFAVDRWCVREWCQSATAHWKDKPAEYLENAAVYAVANLCQSILTIEFLN